MNPCESGSRPHFIISYDITFYHLIGHHLLVRSLHGHPEKDPLVKQKSQQTLFHGCQERLASNPSFHIRASEEVLCPTVEREKLYGFQEISGRVVLKISDEAIVLPRRVFYSRTCK